MQQSIDIIKQHSEEDEGRHLPGCFLPPASLAPHDAECGKEEAGKPHCRLLNIHGQEAGCYCYQQRGNYAYPVADIPKYHQIDDQMENVGMEEAVEKVVLYGASLVEADVPEAA